ncbi:MAG TPA: glycosyltransferase, partial [Anaerolineae bacterium]|nr:glycosyltransferase [Anaerolineae bacterium]
PFGFAPKKTMRARAFRLARALVARGHTVAMFMPPWHTPDEANRQWVEDGVAIHYVAVTGSPLHITRRLIRVTLAWRPDVVHCFKPKAYSGFVAEWLWRTQRKKVRVVVDMDDWEGWGGWNEREAYPLPYKYLFAQQEKWGMRHCHALTVASRALETLAWGHGAVQDTVHYVPNGVGIDGDFSAETPPNPTTLLLYSRLFEFDVARLVKILQQVQAEVGDLRLLMVGASLQAEDGARFHKLMQAAGLAQIIDDVGWLEEAELPAVLSSAAVGIYLMDDNLLNRTKCPVKLADMCALGIPVVAEAVGQVREYIEHGRTGLLRVSGDVGGISTDIITLLRQPVQRQQFASAARQHMQQFNWLQLAARLEAAYQKW